MHSDDRAILDISPRISDKLAVWPGDTPSRREVLMDMANDDNLTLSTLHATVHLGAHADAPSHYARDGATIEQRDLSLYLGFCEVIRVPAIRGTRLSPDVLPEGISAPRVLLCTDTFPDSEKFNEDFAACSVELVDNLHRRGVRLVGVDTPSVDLFHSKKLPAHNAFLRNDMAILEGLCLAHVPPGPYELIALPLALSGFDASPVRAVLRKWVEV